jgi:hypothetical protein
MRDDAPRLLMVFLSASGLILLFSKTTPLGLVGFVAGVAALMLGFFAEYRPIAILGLLIACVVAASTIYIDTLTVVGMIFTATLGLLLPLSALTWFALSVEPWEHGPKAHSRRPSVLSVAYIFACVLSVPAAALVMGVLVPNFSELFTDLMEISIISTVAIIGAVLADPKEADDGGFSGRPG